MSLVPDSSSSSSSGGTAAQPDKTIFLEANANTIIYTVPAGRKFVGYFNTSYGGNTSAMQIQPASGSVVGYQFGHQYNPAYPITLFAGDAVKAWSYAGTIIGVESDA